MSEQRRGFDPVVMAVLLLHQLLSLDDDDDDDGEPLAQPVLESIQGN